MAKRLGFLALLVVTLLAYAPLLAVVFAYQIADAFGCRLDEGGIYPCVAYGRDIGGNLSALNAFGWLMLFTFPLMILSAIIWFVIIVRAARRWRRPAPGT